MWAGWGHGLGEGCFCCGLCFRSLFCAVGLKNGGFLTVAFSRKRSGRLELLADDWRRLFVRQSLPGRPFPGKSSSKESHHFFATPLQTSPPPPPSSRPQTPRRHRAPSSFSIAQQNKAIDSNMGKSSFSESVPWFLIFYHLLFCPYFLFSVFYFFNLMDCVM